MKSDKKIIVTCPCKSGYNRIVCCYRYQPGQDGAQGTTQVRLTKPCGGIVTNSVPLGKSASLLEKIQMKTNNGTITEIGCLYDNGAENTIISENLNYWFLGN